MGWGLSYRRDGGAPFTRRLSIIPLPLESETRPTRGVKAARVRWCSLLTGPGGGIMISLPIDYR
jgi:hypothetical protein